ncbi:MAG TPA: diguanylate cyclase [Anaeromyxobacteraceae bacterium]|nr:diguanylate cyclase [Anaeromyxobacteraceae bacterium]
MPQRVLIVEPSKVVAQALRRHLERGGFAVDLALPAEAAQRLQPGAHAVAFVRPEGAGGTGLAERLKEADPLLPVVLVYEDEEEAADEALVADAVLVGPLSGPTVVSCARAMARLRAQARRLAELERGGARWRGGGDYEFLKKLLLVEVRRSRRYRYPIALALVAVDRWREVADGLDQRARAGLLAELLGVISRAVRDIDLALLYSQDRFLVFMPHTTAESGLHVSTRLASRVRNRAGRVPVTVSVGVAAYEGEGTVSFSTLARAAADALSRAQAAGGDRAERSGARRKRERVILA